MFGGREAHGDFQCPEFYLQTTSANLRAIEISKQMHRTAESNIGLPQPSIVRGRV